MKHQPGDNIGCHISVVLNIHCTFAQQPLLRREVLAVHKGSFREGSVSARGERNHLRTASDRLNSKSSVVFPKGKNSANTSRLISTAGVAHSGPESCSGPVSFPILRERGCSQQKMASPFVLAVQPGKTHLFRALKSERELTRTRHDRPRR